MKKILFTIAITLSLGGCAVLNAIGTATVSGSNALVVANAFDGLEITAAGYLQQPKCGKTASFVCRSPSATAKIIPAVRSGRVTRNQIELCLQAASCPATLTAKLSAINDTLKGVFTQYNIH